MPDAHAMSMPEDERDGLYDATEEYAWDPDLSAPGEAEVFDLLDDGDEDEGEEGE